MDSDHNFCTICSKRHISKPSIEWCSECNQAFCTECSECHRLMSTTENHMTVPIASYDALRTSVLSISNICEDHYETYHLYCQSHDKLLCPTCIEDHSECKDIKSINKITKNIKNSESFNEVRMSLEDMDTNIGNMISEIQINKTRIKEYRGIIAQQACKIREKLNKHLDTLEIRLKEELSQQETEAENNIQVTLKHLEEKKLQISKKQKQMDDITKYASELQTFLGLRLLSSDVFSDESFLQSLVENGSLDTVEIAFELDDNITSFCNIINKFGSVQLRKIPSRLCLENKKDKQAQNIEKSYSIEDIVVKFISTLQVNTTRDTISGCDFLPDGKMVFSIYSQRLKSEDFIVVFNSNGTHLDNISLEKNYAFDVVSLDDKTVAVASPKPDELSFISVDIYRKRLTKTKTNFSCYSITFSDGKLFTNACGRGISIDVTNGNIMSTIRPVLPTAALLASFKSNLYFCDPDTNTISCSDMEGKSIWTFEDARVIKNPRGIAVDGIGNVYVTNQDLNNAIVISPDGNQSRQLLSQSDGLDKPRAIQYDKKRNRLLVANQTKKAFLFDISR